jgi:branched-chain amino acid transport system substrate-binding protein
VTIGTVGEQSGLIGSVLAPGPKAVQAWAAYINAKGGVNCHPVRYIIEDDGGDPSRHQAEVQQLVEQYRVIAIVQEDAGATAQSSVGYLTAKRIPVIGSDTSGQWEYQSPMFFPQATSGVLAVDDVQFAALATVYAGEGKTKIGTISCVEATVCSQIYDAAPKLAPKYGLTLVYRAQASLTQPDYTSYCQAAQSAGAQLIYVGLDHNSMVRVARSCSAVNYHPAYAMVSSTANVDLASDALLDGLVLGMPVAPWMVSSPAVTEFQNALKQYAPGVQPGPASIVGWVSAKLFQLAAQNLSDAGTTQSLLAGLWSIKGDDLGGLTQPLNFTENQDTQPVLCYWIAEIKGGQWISPNGGRRTCR